MDNNRRQSGHLQERQSRRAGMELRHPLAKRLAAYGVAAAGAGLGIIAGAQPAEAKIVYTPANISFGRRAVIDIDGVDFSVTQIKEANFGYTFFLEVQGVGGVQATSRFPGWAARLPAGARIGASGHFYRNPWMARAATYNCCPPNSGPWDNYGGPFPPISGFLGLKFLVDGQAHFGWAEVGITSDPQDLPTGFQGAVKGYAYNTVPNQPILAGQTSDADFVGEIPPQPATLGLLALGGPALDIWRPRKRQLAAE